MRAFKRERSQRRENRDDAEASQRLTESWAKVNCCRCRDVNVARYWIYLSAKHTE